MQKPPLVVDLDGTLTPTDTLVESIIKLVRRNPLDAIRLLFWARHGIAGLKAAVARKIRIAADYLPYRADLLAYLREERARGRKIVLATAAHSSIAMDVAQHLTLFDEVIASDEDCNTKGVAKLQQIEQVVGREFVYAGDSRADEPIWAKASAAVLADVTPRIERTVRRTTPIERTFRSEPVTAALWLKALRAHQWLKNLLIFVPLLTAFSMFEPSRTAHALFAFVAMSLAASATYIFNDLWDLDSDRAHPRKRLRPFASGRIRITHGVFAACLLFVVSMSIALATSVAFAWMLAGYVVLTSLYSGWLKSRVLIDVVMLSVLYTWRILAGSVAVQIEISKWLLAFSIFAFFSLALVKRCSELVSLQSSGLASTTGRDYRVSDLAVLWPIGLSATLSAVVVFGLFITAPETSARYATPELLWVVALVLTYLLCRLWIKTVRGEMHDDPVVYVMRDRKSCGLVTLVVGIMLLAHFVQIAWPFAL
jgi:4-hydroxybenzoate polyprenyltransferase/phosphoserine phosphatase